MDKEQTLFAQIEELDQKIDENNRLITALGKQASDVSGSERSTQGEVLINFLQYSQKIIGTVFDKGEFFKKKKMALLSIAITLILIFTEQLLAALFFGFYSPYSFFVFVPAIYLVLKLLKLSSFKEELGYEDLVQARVGYYGFDKNRLPKTTLRLRRLYVWLTFLGVLGALLNIIVFFGFEPANPKLLGVCIIFEILTAVCLVISSAFVSEFATSYAILFFKKDGIVLTGDVFSHKFSRIK